MAKRGRYCSATCQFASTKTVCHICKKDVDPEWPYCSTCKRGVPKGVEHNAGGLSFAQTQRLWFCGEDVKDPAHEPAWKRKKR